MLNQLNPQQKSALLEIDNPVLILAGAGSGKTKVITHKIAHLIKEYGYAPWNILAVTFTNKAAKEMKNRVFNILGSKEADNYNPYSPKSLWVTTFHSACSRILRCDIEKIGYKSNFSIYDSDDSNKLVKEVIKQNNLISPTENVSSICSTISRSKNQFQKPDKLIQQGIEESNDFINKVGIIYKYYEKKLFENNALDFDDLILKVIMLFEQEKETLEYYKTLFRYVMVDEFQDTNYVQYRLIKLLSKGSSKISVVGDDDQSIYSWRGADISNIINFEKDYKDCKVIKLEQNYRSTNIILNAAQSVVRRNERRLDKNLWSNNGLGEKLKFYAAQDNRNEAKWVIAEILNLYESNKKFNDIGLLYRMNYQSRIFEEFLRRDNIPYKIFGGTKFYERMEIKDLLAYLTILVNENDALAVKRIINVPKRGIGGTTLKKIDTISLELNITLIKAIQYCIDNNIISGSIKNKLVLFLDLLNYLKNIKGEKGISELFGIILDQTSYLEYLKQNHENAEDRIENIKEFGRAILQYETEQIEPTLDHFLMELSLRSEIDALNESDNFVSLMTLHNSKGLEFKNVFIVGMDDGIFPHYLSLDNFKEMEEERRLFYVGVTRAKESCFLSSSHKQVNFGQMKFYKPSRFISEINPDFIDKYEETNEFNGNFKQINSDFYKNQKEIKGKIDNNNPKTNFISCLSEIKVGEMLCHKTFGKGKILKLNEKGEMSTILIQFTDGNRLLILKYAQLTKLKE